MSVPFYSSIPTPPISPQANPSCPPHTPKDNSLLSTIQLLNSLISFYHRERIWVSRTRAALREASHEIDSSSASLPSPPDSGVEPERPQTSTPDPLVQLPFRWQRRKKGFKLRHDSPERKQLYGKEPKENIAQREWILDMFEKTMEARLESCERVNRLVQNANRADLRRR